MRFLRSLLAATTAAATLGACGDGGTGQTVIEVHGTYLLQTMNGQALPFDFGEFEGIRVEITKGTVSLAQAGTFSDVTEFRLTENGVSTIETDAANGTWTLSGSTVNLSPVGFDPYSMTWDGADRLTQVVVLEVGTLTLVYER